MKIRQIRRIRWSNFCFFLCFFFVMSGWILLNGSLLGQNKSTETSKTSKQAQKIANPKAGVTPQTPKPTPNQRLNQPTVVKNLYDYTFAVVKYDGGGDWYEGQVGVKELMKFVNQHKILNAAPKAEIVEISSFDLFEYPLLYLTGHGGFVLSDSDGVRLREYLENGGMLFINDDYGLDPFVQQAVKKVFPERKWVEIPLTHSIFSIYYPFPKGLPKIHKHDGGAPEAYAIFQDGEIAILYTKNTDIGDGWAPYQVHKDSNAVRKEALRFGMNVVLYALVR